MKIKREAFKWGFGEMGFKGCLIEKSFPEGLCGSSSLCPDAAGLEAPVLRVFASEDLRQQVVTDEESQAVNQGEVIVEEF